MNTSEHKYSQVNRRQLREEEGVHAQVVGSSEPPAQVVCVFSIEYLSFSIYYLLEEVFNHMYIIDAQDAGASPPGSAPHLQWGQVGDQSLGMLTKTIYWMRWWFYGNF